MTVRNLSKGMESLEKRRVLPQFMIVSDTDLEVLWVGSLNSVVDEDSGRLREALARHLRTS